MKKIPIINNILMFISLMVFWVIMSGFLDAVHLSMGVVSVLFVMFLTNKIKKEVFFDDEMQSLGEVRFIKVIPYIFWLIWQILVSAAKVVAIILHPTLPIEPAIVRFKVNLPNAQAKAILGNSITLTPGTLTVDIEGDEFVVHALSSASYTGIINDEMPKKVNQLFLNTDASVISDIKIYRSEEELN
jgi:multicomponent Na+:H+ antiporter subunit E